MASTNTVSPEALSEVHQPVLEYPEEEKSAIENTIKKRKCCVCRQSKTLDFFYKSNTIHGGKQTTCKQCQIDASNKWNKGHRERARINARNQRLRKYGITGRKFEQTFDSQGKACAICKNKSAGGRGFFHIDHDHSTNKFREFCAIIVICY